MSPAELRLIDFPSAPDLLTLIDSVQARIEEERWVFFSFAAPGANWVDKTCKSKNFTLATRLTQADQSRILASFDLA
jgi:hypothetical protein